MQSEMLIYLLISFLSGITQTVETENSTTKATSLSTPPPQTKYNSKYEFTSVALETIAPRERGFPFPGHIQARELGASKTATPEQKSSSTALPFVTDIDHGLAIETQSVHFKYQNTTEVETTETSILDQTEMLKVALSTMSTNDESNVNIQIPKMIENAEDILPPEVLAADPFAAALTTESTILASSTLEQNNIHMMQNNSNPKMNLSVTSSSVNNFDEITGETVGIDQTITFYKGHDTDDVNRMFSSTLSTLKPEQKRTSLEGTDGSSTMTLEMQKQFQEIGFIMSEKNESITETTSNIFHTTTMNIITSLNQITEIPMSHSVDEQTFGTTVDEHSTISRKVTTNKNTAMDATWEFDKQHTLPEIESQSISQLESDIPSSSSQFPDIAFVTESTIISSVESTNVWKEPESFTVSSELPSTTANKFSMTESQKQDDGELDIGDENDNVFVGDKTLFSQDNLLKSDSTGTQSVEPSVAETSEENFGVPGFSRIERLGPEATEANQEVQTGIPVDLTKKSDQINKHDEEVSSTSFGDSDEIKDISAFDSSFYQTGPISEVKSSNNERKFESESTSQLFEPTSEPVLLLENEVFDISRKNAEQAIDFKPKIEPEVTVQPKGSKGSKNDENGLSHINNMHVTDSLNVKGRIYKTPFSFRITSIDYIPEFGDPSSGKYRKLRDQLLPDLEEIFGTMFGPVYDGVRLVSFFKGSVIVDGILFTSVRPDDMEQLATELEQRITARNSQIGGNDVDPRSIALDGFVSKNYVERIHEGYTSGSTSSYIVGGSIAIGILVILLIAFIIIATNNRRTNSAMKLKQENVAMVDSNPLFWKNDKSPVDLMGYRNGHIQERTTSTESPIVTVVS